MSTELEKKVASEGQYLESIYNEMHKVIVGQKYMVKRLVLAILCNGHVLLEGVPGLAKTLTISTLAKITNTKFRRIQFTPDLLPADLIGTLVFNPKEGDFSIKKGPIFSNIILADEINRAPSKVQSALLEAMQERQVTIGNETYKLEEPFLVLATQNPLEQQGTYPLPEAQVDRFLMKLQVDYPSESEELEILDRMATVEHKHDVQERITPSDILRLRRLVDEIRLDPRTKDYIIKIVFATRNPENFSGLENLKPLIEYGASPRATIALALCSKANALLNGRYYTLPEDVQAVANDVLRHRVILSYEAEAEEKSVEDIIAKILSKTYAKSEEAAVA